jgi:transcriptional regulator with XRE-family HTH domain
MAVKKRINKQFGKELRALRVFARLTQAELAERVSMHREAIVIIEQGVQNINLHQFEKFASAFNVDPVDLAKAIWKK